jgi:hypothetical protein
VIAAANAGQPIAMRALRFDRFSRSLQRLVAEIEALGRTSVGSGKQR